jgi:hypothetical protein
LPNSPSGSISAIGLFLGCTFRELFCPGRLLQLAKDFKDATQKWLCLQTELLPILAGLLSACYVKACRLSAFLHFSSRTETFFLPPHYYYDALYHKKGLGRNPKLWVAAWYSLMLLIPLTKSLAENKSDQTGVANRVWSYNCRKNQME